MKRTFSRLRCVCAITFLCVSAGANAVIYQAESFNNANDTTAGNSGGACTNNVNVNVDIQGTTDAGGGCNVGWIAQGEWLAFNGLNVPTTGSYTIRLRVASPSGATASVDLNGGAIQLGNFAIPATGGWQTWTTVSRTVTLNAGTYNLGVFAQSANWNFNWIEVVSAGGGGPTLTWSDDFNSINTATWNHEVGGGGWGNNEREYYTAGNNAFIQFDSQAGSNVLVLEARRDNPGNYNCWYGRCEYTSSRMNTSGKRTFQYGRIEARLKLPQTQGIWPAFWMLGNDIGTVGWPASGELDIMEHVGFEPNITHGAMHGHRLSRILHAANGAEPAVQAQRVVRVAVRRCTAFDRFVVPAHDFVEQAHRLAVRDVRGNPIVIERRFEPMCERRRRSHSGAGCVRALMGVMSIRTRRSSR